MVHVAYSLMKMDALQTFTIFEPVIGLIILYRPKYL